MRRLSGKMFKISVSFLSGSFRQVLGVIEENSIFETAVWPIFVLINIVTALKEAYFYFLFIQS